MSESSKLSFSKQVKAELGKIIPEARHCRIAQIAATTAFSFLSLENLMENTQYFTLIQKTINISSNSNVFTKEDEKNFRTLLKTGSDVNISKGLVPVDLRILQQECCKKAYLRGAFISSGSVNNPSKSNHLEIVTEHELLANQLIDVIAYFDIFAKVSKRKTNYVVYLKEGNQIVDFLGLMGAPISLMAFENALILKGFNNDLNRKVNCEVANIQKTVKAAAVVIDDINFIEKTKGLKSLPKGLYEVAVMRRKFPDSSLEELGNKLNPPIGKSGVNHRLRRISEIASQIYKGEEEYEKRDNN